MTSIDPDTKDWSGLSLLGFDTETSGVDVYQDRIVTAALVEVLPGQRPVATTYIVDPGIDIPAESTAVHGMTREWLAANQTHTADQMLFEVAARLAVWMGKGWPVVGFNLAYDFSILEAECHRNSVDPLSTRFATPGIPGPILDVFVLDKQASRRKGKRKLLDVCAHYGVRHTGAHDAGADALAAARLFPKVMAAGAKAFPGQTVGGLHTSQVKWRREQQDSLRAYFDRERIEHDGVDGGWPLYDGVRAMAVAS